MWLVFSIHAKFLNGKNRGKSGYSTVFPGISMLPLSLLTADGKGWKRREGSRDRIHIWECSLKYERNI